MSTVSFPNNDPQASRVQVNGLISQTEKNQHQYAALLDRILDNTPAMTQIKTKLKNGTELTPLETRTALLKLIQNGNFIDTSTQWLAVEILQGSRQDSVDYSSLAPQELQRRLKTDLIVLLENHTLNILQKVLVNVNKGIDSDEKTRQLLTDLGIETIPDLEKIAAKNILQKVSAGIDPDEETHQLLIDWGTEIIPDLEKIADQANLDFLRIPNLTFSREDILYVLDCVGNKREIPTAISLALNDSNINTIPQLEAYAEELTGLAGVAETNSPAPAVGVVGVVNTKLNVQVRTPVADVDKNLRDRLIYLPPLWKDTRLICLKSLVYEESAEYETDLYDDNLSVLFLDTLLTSFFSDAERFIGLIGLNFRLQDHPAFFDLSDLKDALDKIKADETKTAEEKEKTKRKMILEYELAEIKEDKTKTAEEKEKAEREMILAYLANSKPAMYSPFSVAEIRTMLQARDWLKTHPHYVTDGIDRIIDNYENGQLIEPPETLVATMQILNNWAHGVQQGLTFHNQDMQKNSQFRFLKFKYSLLHQGNYNLPGLNPGVQTLKNEADKRAYLPKIDSFFLKALLDSGIHNDFWLTAEKQSRAFQHAYMYEPLWEALPPEDKKAFKDTVAWCQDPANRVWGFDEQTNQVLPNFTLGEEKITLYRRETKLYALAKFIYEKYFTQGYATTYDLDENDPPAVKLFKCYLGEYLAQQKTVNNPETRLENARVAAIYHNYGLIPPDGKEPRPIYDEVWGNTGGLPNDVLRDMSRTHLCGETSWVATKDGLAQLGIAGLSPPNLTLPPEELAQSEQIKSALETYFEANKDKPTLQFIGNMKSPSWDYFVEFYEDVYNTWQSLRPLEDQQNQSKALYELSKSGILNPNLSDYSQKYLALLEILGLEPPKFPSLKQVEVLDISPETVRKKLEQKADGQTESLWDVYLKAEEATAKEAADAAKKAKVAAAEAVGTAEAETKAAAAEATATAAAEKDSKNKFKFQKLDEFMTAYTELYKAWQNVRNNPDKYGGEYREPLLRLMEKYWDRSTRFFTEEYQEMMGLVLKTLGYRTPLKMDEVLPVTKETIDEVLQGVTINQETYDKASESIKAEFEEDLTNSFLKKASSLSEPLSLLSKPLGLEERYFVHWPFVETLEEVGLSKPLYDFLIAHVRFVETNSEDEQNPSEQSSAAIQETVNQISTIVVERVDYNKDMEIIHYNNGGVHSGYLPWLGWMFFERYAPVSTEATLQLLNGEPQADYPSMMNSMLSNIPLLGDLWSYADQAIDPGITLDRFDTMSNPNITITVHDGKTRQKFALPSEYTPRELAEGNPVLTKLLVRGGEFFEQVSRTLRGLFDPLFDMGEFIVDETAREEFFNGISQFFVDFVASHDGDEFAQNRLDQSSLGLSRLLTHPVQWLTDIVTMNIAEDIASTNPIGAIVGDVIGSVLSTLMTLRLMGSLIWATPKLGLSNWTLGKQIKKTTLKYDKTTKTYTYTFLTELGDIEVNVPTSDFNEAKLQVVEWLKSVYGEGTNFKAMTLGQTLAWGLGVDKKKTEEWRSNPEKILDDFRDMLDKASSSRTLRRQAKDFMDLFIETGRLEVVGQERNPYERIPLIAPRFATRFPIIGGLFRSAKINNEIEFTENILKKPNGEEHRHPRLRLILSGLGHVASVFVRKALPFEWWKTVTVAGAIYRNNPTYYTTQTPYMNPVGRVSFSLDPSGQYFTPDLNFDMRAFRHELQNTNSDLVKVLRKPLSDFFTNPFSSLGNLQSLADLAEKVRYSPDGQPVIPDGRATIINNIYEHTDIAGWVETLQKKENPLYETVKDAKDLNDLREIIQHSSDPEIIDELRKQPLPNNVAGITTFGGFLDYENEALKDWQEWMERIPAFQQAAQYKELQVRAAELTDYFKLRLPEFITSNEQSTSRIIDNEKMSGMPGLQDAQGQTMPLRSVEINPDLTRTTFALSAPVDLDGAPSTSVKLILGSDFLNEPDEEKRMAIIESLIPERLFPDALAADNPLRNALADKFCQAHSKATGKVDSPENRDKIFKEFFNSNKTQAEDFYTEYNKHYDRINEENAQATRKMETAAAQKKIVELENAIAASPGTPTANLLQNELRLYTALVEQNENVSRAALMATYSKTFTESAPSADMSFVLDMQKANVSDLKITANGLEFSQAGQQYLAKFDVEKNTLLMTVTTAGQTRDIKLADLPENLREALESLRNTSINAYIRSDNLDFQAKERKNTAAIVLLKSAGGTAEGGILESLRKTQAGLDEYYLEKSPQAETNKLVAIFELGGKNVGIVGGVDFSKGLVNMTNGELLATIEKTRESFAKNPPDPNSSDPAVQRRLAAALALANEVSWRESICPEKIGGKPNPDYWQAKANVDQTIALNQRFINTDYTEGLQVKDGTIIDRVGVTYNTLDAYIMAKAGDNNPKDILIGKRLNHKQTLGVLIQTAQQILDAPCGEGKTIIIEIASILQMWQGRQVIIATSHENLAKEQGADEVNKHVNVFRVMLGDPSFKAEYFDFSNQATKSVFATGRMIYTSFRSYGFQMLSDRTAVAQGREPVFKDMDKIFCFFDEIDTFTIKQAMTPYIISEGNGKHSDLQKMFCLEIDALAQHILRGKNGEGDNLGKWGLKIDEFGKIKVADEVTWLKALYGEGEDFVERTAAGDTEKVSLMHILLHEGLPLPESTEKMPLINILNEYNRANNRNRNALGLPQLPIEEFMRLIETQLFHSLQARHVFKINDQYRLGFNNQSFPATFGIILMSTNTNEGNAGSTFNREYLYEFFGGLHGALEAKAWADGEKDITTGKQLSGRDMNNLFTGSQSNAAQMLVRTMLENTRHWAGLSGTAGIARDSFSYFGKPTIEIGKIAGAKMVQVEKAFATKAARDAAFVDIVKKLWADDKGNPGKGNPTGVYCPDPTKAEQLKKQLEQLEDKDGNKIDPEKILIYSGSVDPAELRKLSAKAAELGTIVIFTNLGGRGKDWKSAYNDLLDKYITTAINEAAGANPPKTMADIIEEITKEFDKETKELKKVKKTMASEEYIARQAEIDALRGALDYFRESISIGEASLLNEKITAHDSRFRANPNGDSPFNYKSMNLVMYEKPPGGYSDYVQALNRIDRGSKGGIAYILSCIEDDLFRQNGVLPGAFIKPSNGSEYKAEVSSDKLDSASISKEIRESFFEHDQDRGIYTFKEEFVSNLRTAYAKGEITLEQRDVLTELWRNTELGRVADFGDRTMLYVHQRDMNNTTPDAQTRKMIAERERLRQTVSLLSNPLNYEMTMESFRSRIAEVFYGYFQNQATDKDGAARDATADELKQWSELVKEQFQLKEFTLAELPKSASEFIDLVNARHFAEYGKIIPLETMLGSSYMGVRGADVKKYLDDMEVLGKEYEEKRREIIREPSPGEREIVPDTGGLDAGQVDRLRAEETAYQRNSVAILTTLYQRINASVNNVIPLDSLLRTHNDFTGHLRSRTIAGASNPLNQEELHKLAEYLQNTQTDVSASRLSDINPEAQALIHRSRYDKLHTGYVLTLPDGTEKVFNSIDVAWQEYTKAYGLNMTDSAVKIVLNTNILATTDSERVLAVSLDKDGQVAATLFPDAARILHLPGDELSYEVGKIHNAIEYARGGHIGNSESFLAYLESIDTNKDTVEFFKELRKDLESRGQNFLDYLKSLEAIEGKYGAAALRPFEMRVQAQAVAGQKFSPAHYHPHSEPAGGGDIKMHLLYRAADGSWLFKSAPEISWDKAFSYRDSGLESRIRAAEIPLAVQIPEPAKETAPSLIPANKPTASADSILTDRGTLVTRTELEKICANLSTSDAQALTAFYKDIVSNAELALKENHILLLQERKASQTAITAAIGEYNQKFQELVKAQGFSPAVKEAIAKVGELGLAQAKKIGTGFEEGSGAFVLGLIMSGVRTAINIGGGKEKFLDGVAHWLYSIPENTGFGVTCSLRDNLGTEASVKFINNVLGTQIMTPSEMSKFVQELIAAPSETVAKNIAQKYGVKQAALNGVKYFLAAGPILFASGAVMEGYLRTNNEQSHLLLSTDPYDQQLFKEYSHIYAMAEGLANVGFEIPSILSPLLAYLPFGGPLWSKFVRFINSRPVGMGLGVGAVQVLQGIINKVYTQPELDRAKAEVAHRKELNEQVQINPPPANISELSAEYDRRMAATDFITRGMHTAGGAMLTRAFTGAKMARWLGLGAKATKALNVAGWITVGLEVVDFGLTSYAEHKKPNPNRMTIDHFAMRGKAISMRDALDIKGSTGTQQMTYETLRDLYELGFLNDDLKSELLSRVPPDYRYAPGSFASLNAGARLDVNGDGFKRMWDEMLAALQTGNLDDVKDFWNTLPIIENITSLSGSVGDLAKGNFGSWGDGEVVTTDGRRAINSKAAFVEFVLSNALLNFYQQYAALGYFDGTAELLVETPDDTEFGGLVGSILNVYEVYNTEACSDLDQKMLAEFWQTKYAGVNLAGVGLTVEKEQCTGLNPAKIPYNSTIDDLRAPGKLFASDTAFNDFMQWLLLETNQDRPFLNTNPELWQDVAENIIKYKNNPADLAKYFQNTVLKKGGFCPSVNQVYLSQYALLPKLIEEYFAWRYNQVMDRSIENELGTINTLKDNNTWSLSRMNSLNSQRFIQESNYALALIDDKDEDKAFAEFEQNILSQSDTVQTRAMLERINVLRGEYKKLNNEKRIELQNYFNGQLGFATKLRTGQVAVEDFASSKVSFTGLAAGLINRAHNTVSKSFKCTVSQGQNDVLAGDYFYQLLTGIASDGHLPEKEWNDYMQQFLLANGFNAESKLTAGQSIFIPIGLLPQKIRTEFKPPDQIVKTGWGGQGSRTIPGKDLTPEAYVNALQNSAKYNSTERLLGNLYDEKRVFLFAMQTLENKNLLVDFITAQHLPLSRSYSGGLGLPYFSVDYEQYQKAAERMQELGWLDSGTEINLYTVLNVLRARQALNVVCNDPETKQFIQKINADPLSTDKRMAVIKVLVTNKISLTSDYAEVVCQMQAGQTPLNMSLQQISRLAVPADSKIEAELDAFFVLTGVVTVDEVLPNRNTYGVKPTLLEQKFRQMSAGDLSLFIARLAELYGTNPSYAWKIESMIMGSPVLIKAMLSNLAYIGLVTNMVDSRLRYPEDYLNKLNLTINTLSKGDSFAQECAGFLRSIRDF
ncbi:hypothetical protein NO2_0801 [Candidatus Termititenax persephonae]|uniref:SecA family profile domain-containing protein n=1 Tax=Candidatus Termititenax persephonae TaxID=2218525 RepID=A0A388THM3_9BACT|nr:hypothetical protein NO2_0801 [Candidatus Termititenax persephonae]